MELRTAEVGASLEEGDGLDHERAPNCAPA
jgi:hypothetical protein